MTKSFSEHGFTGRSLVMCSACKWPPGSFQGCVALKWYRNITKSASRSIDSEVKLTLDNKLFHEELEANEFDVKK